MLTAAPCNRSLALVAGLLLLTSPGLHARTAQVAQTSASVPGATAAPGAAVAPVDYIIGPSDIIAIANFDQADLSGNFTVDADGTFTFPYIGRVKAGGLTLRQLEAALKRELANGYFVNPQLSVSVNQYRSQQVFVVGEVRTPGPYAMTGPMTLIEAIAKAGSTLPSASEAIKIVRPVPGAAVVGPIVPRGTAAPAVDPADDPAGDPADVIEVNLRALQSGDLSKNLHLHDGDTVFVPRADMIYVFGQVKAPGAYPVQPNTSVLQALSLAGGVSDRGSTGRIRIVRFVNGVKEELKVKLSDIVQPGDTIMVPQRFF